MVKPMSKGCRKKLEMKKIENKVKLGITFSKRRGGLFKKANELVTLCGIQLAIIIFSSGKAVYSFGHPNVYDVIDQFLNGLSGKTKIPTITNSFMNEFQKKEVDILVTKLKEVQNQIEIEKKIAKEKEDNNIFNIPSIDQLSLPQAQQLQTKLKELKERIISETKRRLNSSNLENYASGDGGNGVGSMNELGAPGTNNLDIPGPSYGSWNF